MQAGVDATIVNDEILSNVEAVFANAMLPDLFPSLCTNRRRLQADVVGLSSAPPDAVLNGKCAERHELSFAIVRLIRGYIGVSCEGTSATSNCFVIQGRATLSLTQSADASQVISTARDSISNSISNGDLNSVDTRISSATSRSEVTIPRGEPRAPEDDQPGFPIYGWIFVAGGSVIFIVTVVFCVLRRRRNNKDGAPVIGAAYDEDDIAPASEDDNFYFDDSQDPQAMASGRGSYYGQSQSAYNAPYGTAAPRVVPEQPVSAAYGDSRRDFGRNQGTDSSSDRTGPSGDRNGSQGPLPPVFEDRTATATQETEVVRRAKANAENNFARVFARGGAM